VQRFIRSQFLWFVYLVVGVVIAISENYFDFNFPWKPLISAILVVLLWPLELLGVDLRIK
jgi:hypothetical protein